MASVLGLDSGQEGIVNGYALATGVRDEFDWDDERTGTRSLEEAFGEPFERIWIQLVGANRSKTSSGQPTSNVSDGSPNSMEGRPAEKADDDVIETASLTTRRETKAALHRRIAPLATDRVADFVDALDYLVELTHFEYRVILSCDVASLSSSTHTTSF